MRKRLTFLALLLSGFAWMLIAPPTSAQSPTTVEDEVLRRATLVFARATRTPNAAIPATVMLRARGVVVIPAAHTAGTLYYGIGAFSARQGPFDEWTPPAMLAFQGALPVALESQDVDFVLLPMTPLGMNTLLQERHAGGSMGPIAAGGMGPHVQAGLSDDILGYVRFGNYFAGMTIDDWQISEMPVSNKQLYGRAYSTDDIVRGTGFFHLPKAARQFREALSAYFRDMS
jgi:lipid-binding SYLF domain-containing protein